jgi:hypothetical protein
VRDNYPMKDRNLRVGEGYRKCNGALLVQEQSLRETPDPTFGAPNLRGGL